MNQFLNDLIKLKRRENINIFWTQNWMYVNDESDNQAIATDISLIDAYKFANLIYADSFDYEANDKEIEEFGILLLEKSEQEKNKINVFEYIDNISENFEKLTKIKLGIDQKRALINYMAEPSDIDALSEYGSTTFIAKMLWDYIKGNSYKKIKPCEEEKINKLADKYLLPDEYDIIKFRKELNDLFSAHHIVIDGSLWVNDAKFEYVDEIIITKKEVIIMNKGYQIGNIKRNKLHSLIEQNYNLQIETDLIDNLYHLFDIRKTGDL